MPRSRNIKPGFFKNERLAECNPLGRILFAGLWCLADGEGRLEDRPKRIKVEVLPYDDCDVNELLQELHNKGFILRYQVSGQGYISVLNWHKHQRPHVKEAESGLPVPEIPVLAPEKPGQAPILDNTNPPDSLSLDSLNLIPDSLNSDTLNRFAEFWDKYPKKKSKGQAEKAWSKLKLSDALFNEIMTGLGNAKVSRDWTKEGGKYIPYPATWLNAKGWEDEHIPGQSIPRAYQSIQEYVGDDQ